MSDTNETLADITAEMRNGAAEDIAYSPNDINELADRIEAAAERERALAGDDQFAPHYEAQAPAKFDEAEFDAAVAKLNGWDAVADPVAEIRRMRDGTPSSPEAVLEVLQAFHDAHYSVFPRDELTERLCHAYYDQFVADAPAGNAAAMREALEKFLHLARSGLAFVTSYRYTEAENEELEAAFDNARAALAAPQRNCDRYRTWDKAWDAFSKSYFGPTDPGDLEYYFGVWLFAKAEGGAE